METSSFWILVADSFEPWLRYVRSTVNRRDGLLIVGEARDGLQAVQKAIQLRPDLILLNISLDTINGVEAAKQIRKAFPGVKLLFVTQIIDQDIMAEALGNGADGYILKMDAEHELLPAIEAIRRGEKFISGGMKG